MWKWLNLLPGILGAIALIVSLVIGGGGSSESVDVSVPTDAKRLEMGYPPKELIGTWKAGDTTIYFFEPRRIIPNPHNPIKPRPQPNMDVRADCDADFLFTITEGTVSAALLTTSRVEQRSCPQLDKISQFLAEADAAYVLGDKAWLSTQDTRAMELQRIPS